MLRATRLLDQVERCVNIRLACNVIQSHMQLQRKVFLLKKRASHPQFSLIQLYTHAYATDNYIHS